MLSLPAVPFSDKGKCSDPGCDAPVTTSLRRSHTLAWILPGSQEPWMLSLAGPLGTQLLPLHLSVAK